MSAGRGSSPVWASGCSRERKTLTTRALSEMRPVPRRGLSRDEAAMYVGVSAGKFDEMVGDGRMPAPVRIDHRKI